MKKVQAAIDKLLYALMILLFVTMFGVTTLNVIMRYFFNTPIAYAVELGRYCFAGVIYLGAIYVMRDNGHIGLDIFVNKMPKKMRDTVNLCGRILVFFFLLIFTWQAIKMTLTSITVKSSALQIPMAIPYSAMVVGGFGMMIEIALNILHPERIPQLDPDTTSEEGGVL